MSIELDWQITEAPGEGGPAAQGAPPAGGRSRWRGWRLWLALLAAAALLLGAGLALRAIANRGWERIRQQVSVLVILEEELARAGDVEALLALQDPADLDWRRVRAALAETRLPAPAPLPGLRPAGDHIVLRSITSHRADMVRVEVERTYTDPAGRQFTFYGPQFYRRAPDGQAWLRIAPPPDFWEEPRSWRSEALHVVYLPPDEAMVAQLAPLLDERLRAGCLRLGRVCSAALPVALWLGFSPGLGLPAPLNERLITLQVPGGRELGIFEGEVFLALPSLQISQLPADEAARAAVADRLTELAARFLGSKLYRTGTQADIVYYLITNPNQRYPELVQDTFPLELPQASGAGRDLTALVLREEQLALAADVPGLLDTQDPNDPDWRDYRAALAREGLPVLPPLVPDLRLEVGTINLVRITALGPATAQVEVERRFLRAPGDSTAITFRYLQFYRLSHEGWVRTAPPVFSSALRSWQGQFVHLVYFTPDEPTLTALAHLLDARLGNACQRLGDACSSLLPVSLWFGDDARLALENATALPADSVLIREMPGLQIVPGEQFRVLPSLQFSGLPGDSAASNALAEQLARIAADFLDRKLLASLPPGAIVNYTVLRDDTLTAIADRLHSTVEAIRAENRLDDPDRLMVGQRLRVPANLTPRGTAPSPLSPAAPLLARAGPPPDPLTARRGLTFTYTRAYDSSPAPLPAPRPEPGAVRYSVRPFDTLESIAAKFGLHPLSVLAANPRLANPERIYPGLALTIPARPRPPSAPPHPTVSGSDMR